MLTISIAGHVFFDCATSKLTWHPFIFVWFDFFPSIFPSQAVVFLHSNREELRATTQRKNQPKTILAPRWRRIISAIRRMKINPCAKAKMDRTAPLFFFSPVRFFLLEGCLVESWIQKAGDWIWNGKIHSKMGYKHKMSQGKCCHFFV